MTTQNPPPGYPRVIPYLYYRDCAAALEFLCGAFGFRERLRMPRPDGTVMHAEVELDDGVVMLGSPADDAGLNRLAELEIRASSVMVYVDDVDAHHAAAIAAGATVTAELEDKFYGDRMYGVRDLEGHHWYFATHVKDVAPEDMRPPGG